MQELPSSTPDRPPRKGRQSNSAPSFDDDFTTHAIVSAFASAPVYKAFNELMDHDQALRSSIAGVVSLLMSDRDPLKRTKGILDGNREVIAMHKTLQKDADEIEKLASIFH